MLLVLGECTTSNHPTNVPDFSCEGVLGLGLSRSCSGSAILLEIRQGRPSCRDRGVLPGIREEVFWAWGAYWVAWRLGVERCGVWRPWNGLISFLGGGNSNIFYFHPELWGRFPFWLIFFQMGWNHQPVLFEFPRQVVTNSCSNGFFLGSLLFGCFHFQGMVYKGQLY